MTMTLVCLAYMHDDEHPHQCWIIQHTKSYPKTTTYFTHVHPVRTSASFVAVPITTARPGGVVFIIILWCAKKICMPSTFWPSLGGDYSQQECWKKERRETYMGKDVQKNGQPLP